MKKIMLFVLAAWSGTTVSIQKSEEQLQSAVLVFTVQDKLSSFISGFKNDQKCHNALQQNFDAIVTLLESDSTLLKAMEKLNRSSLINKKYENKGLAQVLLGRVQELPTQTAVAKPVKVSQQENCKSLEFDFEDVFDETPYVKPVKRNTPAKLPAGDWIRSYIRIRKSVSKGRVSPELAKEFAGTSPKEIFLEEQIAAHE